MVSPAKMAKRPWELSRKTRKDPARLLFYANLEGSPIDTLLYFVHKFS